MRNLLATALAASVALTGAPQVRASTRTAAEQAQGQDPKELYSEGRKSFRLGRYEDAVAKFEEAYALTDNALLLYNIGLAYWRWYGVSNDVAHLRKAKAILQNFVLEAQKNPEKLGDPAEAVTQIQEIDKELAKAEEQARERRQAEQAAEQAAAEEAPESEPEPTEPQGPAGPDPGRKLRLGGIISMGLGGALVVGGVVAGSVFALKGQEFQEQLGNSRNEFDELNCDTAMETDPDRCSALPGIIDTTRQNGRLANTYTVVSFAAVGGLGAAGLATGIALFILGKKRTDRWKSGQTAARLQVMPSLRGLTIRGRF